MTVNVIKWLLLLEETLFSSVNLIARF